MPPLKKLRGRLRKWVWDRTLACCCLVETLESWESLNPDDWDEKLLSPWDAKEHGVEYGHLVSLEAMRKWRERGDFLRALKSEDLLSSGSMINQHPVLNICLGFRDCELSAGKDYSCYCRVRRIFRGKTPEETGVDGKLDCEPVYDGMIASHWVTCIDPMLDTLWGLSSLRHKRSNFSVKKCLTNDAIMSDPIHMMYVHIEGMIPQFGPFMFEVWRRNQGLQMGFTGDSLRHGFNIIISNPRRQSLEAQLRQMFPNKPLRLRRREQVKCSKRKRTSLIGESSSAIFVSLVAEGRLGATLKRRSPLLVPLLDSCSAMDFNQSAQASEEEEAAVPLIEPETIQGETNRITPRVDNVLLPAVPHSKRYSQKQPPQRNSLPKMLRRFVRRIIGRHNRNRQ